MDYSEIMLRMLDEYRRNEHLCDVILLVGDQRFPAHRNVLSASSVFFYGLFSSSMKEKQEGTVSLEQFPASIMEDLLTYLYTGKLEVTEGTAQDFLVAADFLLLPALKILSERTLVDKVNLTNCISTLQFAETYQCVDLQRESFSIIMQNFSEVAITEEFQTLSYGHVLDLVTSENILVKKEEEVFEAILHWMGSDMNRQGNFSELFSKLRIFSMKEDYVQNDVLSCSHVQEIMSCLTAVENVKSYNPTSPHCLRPRSCLDEYTDVVILCNRAFDPKVVCFVPGQDEWFDLVPIPDGFSWQCLVYCNGCLYALSGNGWSGCINPASHVHCYDPAHNTWSPRAPLLRDTDEFGAAVIGTYIYVVGGHNRHGIRIELVQRYDTCANTWDLVCPLFPARSGSSVVTHGGLMYVIGGTCTCTTNEECLNSAMVYDPSKDSWTEINTMRFSRSLACATVVGDKIFVISGHSDEIYSNNSINDIKPITACEVYDIKKDTWIQVPDIHLQRSNAGIAYVHGKIYVFGGDDMISFAEQEESMEYFDMKTNEWSMPVDFTEIEVNIARPRACPMRLPKNFIQTLNTACWGFVQEQVN